MSTVCYCGQSMCPATGAADPGACIASAQAECAALRDRVAELEAEKVPKAFRDAMASELTAERDEWKAKAEAAEAQVAEIRRVLNGDHSYPMLYLTSQVSVLKLGWERLLKERNEAEKQRDEAAALAERFRGVLTDAPSVLAPDPEWVLRVDAALSEPIAPWLRERDRKLAMRVAEDVAEACAVSLENDELALERFPRDLAAIVDEALKVTP